MRTIWCEKSAYIPKCGREIENDEQKFESKDRYIAEGNTVEMKKNMKNFFQRCHLLGVFELKGVDELHFCDSTCRLRVHCCFMFHQGLNQC